MGGHGLPATCQLRLAADVQEQAAAPQVHTADADDVRTAPRQANTDGHVNDSSGVTEQGMISLICAMNRG